jgi:hypothetical protein
MLTTVIGSKPDHHFISRGGTGGAGVEEHVVGDVGDNAGASVSTSLCKSREPKKGLEGAG